VLTAFQIYGYDRALSILTSSNKIILSLVLPLVPTGLVASRFVCWQDYFINLFPDYFYQRSSIQTQKQSGGGGNDAQKDAAKFLATIRQIVGGLLLPTIAVSIDQLLLRHILPLNSSCVMLRTIIAGIAYTSIKGLTKIFLVQKKNWQQANREIQDYKCLS
jgi:hypothetical protein